MRILQLTPGTGSFLCGSCLRDNTLVKALRELGHGASIVPLYLPFALEEGGEGDVGHPEVHMGGINVYLQQVRPWLVRLPRALGRLLDKPALLRFLAARSNMTDPAGLGAMTLSVLRGEEGRQAGEVHKLIAWLRTQERPDVVLLSNAMLLGLARRIRVELGLPVLCTLQGEAPFLDALPIDYARACWSILRERARDVDAFLAVSHFTADLMGERLDIPKERLHVVHNGIECGDFIAAQAPPAQPTIAFLARLCPDKGLGHLVDAFIELRQRGRLPGLRLLAGGVSLRADEPFVKAQEAKLREAGAAQDGTITRNLSRGQKLALLHTASVFSVPAQYGESFGLYLLEALASGVPVVQPHSQAFPEILAATGGGLTYGEGHHALADALEELLLDPERARELGRVGSINVRAQFTAERMAREVVEVCSMCLPQGET